MTLYAALAVISAATLAYEVLLVRLFAIVQWHHFAFMAISIALLGFGASGTLLAIVRERVRARFAAVFSAGAVLFAAAAPAAFMAAQALPFNALAVVWEPQQLLYLPAMYLLLAVPLFAGATCIGAAFVRFGDRIGGLYACNLIGSGAGALGVVAVLFWLAPAETLRLIAGLGLVAAALVLLGGEPAARPAPAFGALALAVVALVALPERWLEPRVSEFKGLSGALRVAGAKVLAERSGPLGLLTVVENPEVPFRYVPGLSLNAPAAPPPQLGVFVDGDSMTAIARGDGRPAAFAYLGYTTDALVYHLTRRPAVLVLGAGGGQAVIQALHHGARRIDAVELDRNMVRLATRDFADYAGGLWSRPEVRVHVADARRFVAAGRDNWDVVQIPLLDSAGGATGVFGLSESYVYTREAFADYLARLAPGGWLSVSRWLTLPPRDALKLFATALDAVAEAGVAAPERRLILLRGLTTTTLLIKNGDVTAEDVAAARAFAAARSFDLAYFPGIAAADTNRFNVLERPYYFEGATALAGPGRAAFTAGYKFDIRPATDERPYFFDFLKWRSLPELFAIRKSGGAGLIELGGLILAATLVQAAALSAVLIAAPLWARRRALAQSPGVARVGLYFLALGLAFLFVEIAFIQKLILFLGHPLYAVAVALTGFLVFAGVGSGVSDAFARRVDARVPGAAIAVAAAAIVAIALLYVALLPHIFAALAGLGDAARVTVSLAVIAPLAFFMGIPFPLGLSRIDEAAPALVPWAWGVNGCASVLSPLIATLLAMQAGFSAVVVAGAALYALAAVVAWRPLAAE